MAFLSVFTLRAPQHTYELDRQGGGQSVRRRHTTGVCSRFCLKEHSDAFDSSGYI